MIEDHALSPRYDETADGDLPPAPEEQGAAVVLHERDRLEAVAPHLSLLRSSLACDAGRGHREGWDGRAAHGHVPARRREPSPASAAGRLTLPQWVSRTTGIR